MRINSEKAKNIKTTVVFLSLTTGIIFLILKFGLSTAVKISEFLQKNQPGYQESPLDSYLSAPNFFPVVEATNSANIPVEGYAPANKEVVITLNNVEDQSLSANSEGKFAGILNLALGINTFYAATRDFKGNLSANSDTQTIFYSNTPPFIEILDPQPDSVIKNNADIVIKGKTDVSAKVYVNDHFIRVESDGSFSYPVKLSKGDNLFKVISIDPAQNQTLKEFTLQFRP